MAIYDLTSTIPSKIKKGDILNCPYSGAVKSVTLPKGKYKLECWGAQGESAGASSNILGGHGGYSVGTVEIKENTIIYLYTGGQNGFNGGGTAAKQGGNGGGGTDIRVATDSLYARIIVAGGGGGGASHSGQNGGVGGGDSGNKGSGYSSTYVPTAGTQTSGGTGKGYSTYVGSDGTFGFGGNSATGTGTYNVSAGGGGGWYGGGGSGYYSNSRTYYRYSSGAAGGSGYIYTSATASNYPSGCLLNSAYYLTDASTIAGNTAFASPTGTSETGHNGDGYIRITAIEVKTVTFRFFKHIPTSGLYIESTGSQYIDTGIKAKSTLKIILDFESTEATGVVIVGYYNGEQDDFRFFNSAQICYLDYGNAQSNRIQGGSIPINTRFKLEIGNFYVKNLATGVNIVSGTPVSAFTKDTNVFICGNVTPSKNKIYSCKIYDGDTLVRDFIPTKNDSNIPCLYDKVTKAYFLNNGTGNFNYVSVAEHMDVITSDIGYVKIPSEDEYYLESSGTQYIDTGFKPNQNTRVVLDGQYLGDSSEYYLYMFSAMDTTANARYSVMYGIGKGAFSSEMNDDTSAYFSNTIKSTDRIRIDKNKNICTINGETVTNAITTFQAPVNLCLFAMNRSSGISRILKHRIYSCKIYDNDVLVRDFIPAKDGSNIACLYDKVSQTYFYNQGTGNFTFGTVHKGGWKPITAQYVKVNGQWKLEN